MAPKKRDWFGCYGESWGQEIRPEAYGHPAKFSRALIRRIYEHALERGYLREGDTVLDPFDGVALGALDAMFHGLHHIGCELEEKFVGLGRQNIDLWNSRYGNGKLPRWGTAVILQGDSRELARVLAGARAEGIISSPPWESVGNYDDRVANIDKTASIIPSRKNAGTIQKTYGETNGQLGQESGDTFWSAARAILLQCHQVLAPGGVAIWVLKDFIRAKKRVDFTGQWRSLCESCGFETIEVIRAWLIEDLGAQFALDGELVEKQVARKSFFRRLHESKYPHLSIDYEIVLVTRKA